jgi:uncharacterized membrane protein
MFKSKLNSKYFQVKFFLILFVAISIFFRFTDLSLKVYWVDEVFTSLRISGYSEKDVSQKLFSGSLVSRSELEKYQYPAGEKSAFDTIKGLAEKEPQQTPLYFIILRFWTQIFGNSITVIRSCSAFFSVLTIPAIYWLCRELFESVSVSYFAIALTAVSPLYLLYAQEARSYSLWGLLIVLSNAALLMALRVNKRMCWFLYSLTLIFGFYTFLYSVFVAFGQGIYVIVQEKFKLNKTVKLYLLSSGFAIIAFIPWLNIIISNKQAISTYTGWQDGRIGFLELVSNLIAHFAHLFIDFDLSANINSVSYWLYQGINYSIIILIIYAIYLLIRRTESKIYLFILSLILPTGLGIILLDLIQGKHTVVAARYFMPCYLGINLAVAYLIDQQLISGISQQVKKVWKLVVIFLISLSFLSCINILQAETWWTKSGGYIPQIGRFINKAKHPLVINEGDFWLISLSYYLEDKSKIMVVDAKKSIDKLPAGFSDYFVFHSSPELIKMWQNNQNYKLIPLENIDSSVLFKIE